MDFGPEAKETELSQFTLGFDTEACGDVAKFPGVTLRHGDRPTFSTDATPEGGTWAAVGPVDGAWCERSVRDRKDIPRLRHNKVTFWTLASWVDFRLRELEYFFAYLEHSGSALNAGRFVLRWEILAGPRGAHTVAQ